MCCFATLKRFRGQRYFCIRFVVFLRLLIFFGSKRRCKFIVDDFVKNGMAIYHFSGTFISRSQGRSIVACAAYRAGECLYDARYGKQHDYTGKRDVVHREILLPEAAPQWMADREKLWNAIEAVEKRKDSQLAREFNFALPRELTREQNIILAKAFIEKAFVSKGIIADMAMHEDRSHDGESQPHVHVLLTTREIKEDGFGLKITAWNAKPLLMEWREQWAELANEHLRQHGHAVSIDHRTLAAQGIDLEPQYKIGAVAARQQMARLADHQRIARENGDKLLADPTIALTALTRQYSTFTHQDLARFVNRHTVDAEQFQAVYDKIRGCPHMVTLGLDEQKRERLTTREMLTLETRMIEQAVILKQREGHAVAEGYQALALLQRTLSTEQQVAFEHLVSAGDLKSVVGYAGSGKSYLLGAAKAAWEGQGYQVRGITLSGIAAENLQAGSGIISHTLASRCYYWDKGEQRLSAKDVLVVDEAGMLGSRQLQRLLEEAQQAGAKVVLVGDPYQLQAIEAGGAFRAIVERSPTVTLMDIRRQRVEWQKVATLELATGKTAEALQRYAQHLHVHAFATQAVAKQSLVEWWNDVRLSQPATTQLMLAYTRQDVQDLNDLARQLRRTNGELGEDHVCQTARGERCFAEGERIYFLKNDRKLGVKNGTLGTIERFSGERLVVRLDQGEGAREGGGKNVGKSLAATSVLVPASTISFSVEDYPHVDYGYAATIHKAQGVTVDRAYLLASRYLDSHATYVGLSRHRDSVDIFYGQDEFANEQALARTMGRERSKDVTLDYVADEDLTARKAEADIEKAGIETKAEKAHSVEATIAEPAVRDMNYIPPTLEEMTPEQIAECDRLFAEGATPQARAQLKQWEAIYKPLDIEGFSRDFEAKYPEQARAIQEAIRPPHEKLARKVIQKMQRWEKTLEEGLLTKQEYREWERYAAKVVREHPEALEYLRKHQPEMREKVFKLVQAREARLERAQELGLGMSR